MQLSLTNEKVQLADYYAGLLNIATAIDITLADHVSALQTKAANGIDNLEKKLLRAEKRKFEAQQRQISNLKKELFPNNSLQERVDNFAPYYATYGKEWLKAIYDCSLTLEQQFGIIAV